MRTRPRVLHVYKTAAPESSGGVPAVMKSISAGLSDRFDFGFLIASNKGASYFEPYLGSAVTAVRHFGHVLSMPIAPTDKKIKPRLPTRNAAFARRRPDAASHNAEGF